MASLMEHTGSQLDINVLLDFKDVREAFCNALQKDPSLRYSYQSNIAMLLHDRYSLTDHADRNRAANDILCLLFES